MGSVKTSLFRDFLKSQGCNFHQNRKRHEVWGRKDLNRPIIFQRAKKEIPWFHIKKNLETLGVGKEEFLKFIGR